MKPHHKTALLSFLAGVLFLIASPQYASLCTEYPSPKGESMVEFAFGLPAMAFTFAGVVGVIAGVVLVIVGPSKPGRAL